MIEVEHLTKRYTRHTAVSDVSFHVGRGEIVGLLGPNGAGKSTIMRILSCYMPASTGTVRIAGFDVFSQPDEVRRRIGYMPENNPLHKEMRVKEYLAFRGALKGLSRSKCRERLEVVLHQCGLLDVARKLVGHLSKGYQQRVGLADALIHEPELIILDEPTIGLDPNQIRSVRQLIKDLGQKHTVLISTHILPEVEMTCNRVLILHQGKILAADTTDNLQRTMSDRGKVVAEIAAPVSDLKLCWDQIPEIENFDLAPAEGDYIRCSFLAHGTTDLRPIIYEVACRNNWPMRELSRSRYSLEDIFVRITRADREEEGT
ncbi:MAG: transporter related-protein [Verrucomicrobiales bacterium]|nr:transporter related-protein [Verrucomicrobiales bacterium]